VNWRIAVWPLYGVLAGCALPAQTANSEVHLQRGIAYLQNGDERAVEELRRAVEVAPSSAEAHNWLGVAYASKVDLQDAISEFRQALRLDPNFSRGWTNLGSALARAGDIKESVEAFRKAVDLSPADLAARMNLAVALRGAGDAKGALEHVRYVAAKKPDDSGVQFELAQTLRQSGDLEGAIAAFETALGLNPELREGYYNLGTALRQLAARRSPAAKDSSHPEGLEEARRAAAHGDFATAEERLNILLERDPANASAQNLLGFVLGQKRDLPAAITHLSRAVELRPDDAEAHYNLGAAFWYSGARDKAVTELRESVRLNPASGESYILLGAALKESGDLGRARASLQRAIALLPPGPAPYVDLGLIFLASGDVAHAIGQFEAALNLPASPTPKVAWDVAAAELRKRIGDAANAETHVTLGRILGRAGAPANEIVAEFREAVRLRPDYAEAYNDLGLALMQNGDDDGAIAAFRKAIQHAPNYADAHANLGGALTATDVPQAIEELEKAVTLDPPSTKAQYNLALAYGLSPAHGTVKEIEILRRIITAEPAFTKAHLELGKALLRSGQVAEAVDELTSAVRLEPESGEAHYQLGLALARSGRQAEAAPELQKGRELVAATERAQLAALDISEGREALEKGDAAEALVKFRRVLKVQPDSPVVNRMIGLALKQTGDRAGAATAFRKALELDPNDAAAKRGLEELSNAVASVDDPQTVRVMETLIRERKFQEAELHLVAYLEQNPKSAWGWYALGYSQFGQKKIGESIRSLAQSLQLDIKNAEAHKILGRDLMIIGRFDVARSEFEQAIQINPSSAELYYNLGKLFSIEDNWGPAKEALDHSVRLDPSYKEAWDALGFAKEALGDDAGAVAAYETAVRLNAEASGTFSAGHVDLSAYYNRTGKPDLALEYATQAIALNPDSDRAWFQKGKAHERLGELAPAVDALKQAVGLNAHAASYYYVLATLYRRLGRDDESKNALQQFAKLDRESSELDRKRRELAGGEPHAGERGTQTGGPHE
jgi:Flp pilus assembly protein TadD